MKKIPVVLLLTMLLSVCLFGEENNNGKSNVPLYKPTATSDIWLDVNRVNAAFRNNGIWHYDMVGSTWGVEWPKGSGNSPIFAGGQYIAASVNGEIKVAGVQHSSTEYQAGMILPDGTADNHRDGKYIWYELRSSGSDDRSRWPVDQGAPVDENGDPLLIGDQTIFSVWNDLADHSEYGTNKLGVEVRQTAFAFNRADALGDMQFIKWQMVNKSGEDWDSTYFGIWLDPDLGGATDDLVGCDSILGLGFTYNAVNNDQSYGTPPPAQGIDFFQGPIIPDSGSTVTLPNGTVLQDKKMLKMTAFVYYDNDPSPKGNPDTGQDVWNYLTGFWKDNLPITYGERGRTGTVPTKFMFSGDPETEQGTGWLDAEPDDRRFIMTTGPFTMPAWKDEGLDGIPNTGDEGEGNDQPDFGEPGVQEIVAGVILATGTDNLNSVTKLKEVDGLAQLAYDLDFNLANGPLPPVVTPSIIANEVILTWDETSEFNADGSPYSSEDPIVVAALGDTVIIGNVEQIIDDADYNFYGYSVYQYSDASGRDPVLLEHWDIGPTADATNYTAQRFAKMTQNKNSVVGNAGLPLVNGKEYYFGVVAEGYLAYGAPVILTSAPTIVSVTPRSTFGISSYSSQYGDTLTATHLTTADTSDGSTVVWVVDPSKTTGLGYTVSFNADLTWNLVNSLGDTVAKNQTNQTGDDAYNIYDGLMIKVQGPAAGINMSKSDGWDYQGGRWMSGYDWGGGAATTFFGGLSNNADFFGSDLGPADYTDVELRWAGATDRTDMSAAGLAAASQAEDPTRWSKAVVYRRDLGYVVQSTLGDIPFAAYDTWAVPERRLKVVFVEMDGEGGAAANLLWDMGWDGAAFADDHGAREYIFILNETYDEFYTDYLNGTLDGTFNNTEYAFWPKNRGSAEYLGEPFEMQIYAGKPNTTADSYTFTAPAAASATTASKKSDMEKIKVVPNPYYGYHSGEMDPYNRWVQFTYLPAKCTVRIFDLAGNIIRKLEKDDSSTPLLEWDLKNEYELPVASGIYIFHVDAPGLGEKVGKMAIFTPNERLDTW